MRPTTSHRPRPLSGPPLRLPPVLDAVAERWWQLAPRSRLVLWSLGALVLVAGAFGFLTQASGGTPVRVVVADRQLLPGEVIAAADLRAVDWPGELVPTGAHGSTRALVGANVRALLPEGAAVTDDHLGSDGAVAGLRSGQVAVPVELDRLPRLVPGARIDVVGAGPDGVGRTLATAGTVLSTDDTHVWLGIDPDVAAAVSSAAGAGAISVVVHAPSRSVEVSSQPAP